jgi:hypothetical protein
MSFASFRTSRLQGLTPFMRFNCAALALWILAVSLFSTVRGAYADSTVDYDLAQQVTIARLDGIDAARLYEGLRVEAHPEEQTRAFRKEFATEDRKIEINCNKKFAYLATPEPIFSCQIQLNEKRKSDTTLITAGPNSTRVATVGDVSEARLLFQALGSTQITVTGGNQTRHFQTLDGKARVTCESNPDSGLGDTQCQVQISLKI